MIGQKLLHYEIVEKLGEGGMGVVYKARDTHLDRFVAVKVLPPEKVADAGRKARFVQEAKAASALNHPNIVTVHDISSEGGVDFIAMEFVAGKTLDQLIPRKGMRLNDALKIAVQIADALTRAHAAGIVHRDLKPSNVMLDEHGLVKVLDFGLAKLTETALGEDEATRTVKPRTEEGTVVGTAAYMSPEQAEGKPVDARSDIFSFGAVLYEMVTGRRAFQGDSRMSTLSAVLHKEPGPMGAEIPRELERIILRCLRKDPARRLQTMADLKVALEDLKEESDSGKLTPAAPKLARRRRLLWAAVALTLLVAGAGTVWLLRSAGGKPAPAMTVTPLTAYPGNESGPSFSPDGGQVVFSWDGEKKRDLGIDLYVKLLSSPHQVRLTFGPERSNYPAWSPDGTVIVFIRSAGDQLSYHAIPSIGGPERILKEAGSGNLGRVGSSFSCPAASWFPEGKWLLFSDWTLFSMETGESRPLASSSPGNQAQDRCPAVSPDGRTVAFSRFTGTTNAEVYLLDLTEDLKPKGEARRLTHLNRLSHNPNWTADGREVLFVSGRTWLGGGALYRIAAAGRREPEPLPVGTESVSGVATARQPGRFAFSRRNSDTNIFRIPLSGAGQPAGPAQRLISSTRRDYGPEFSPDGSRIAFVSDRGGSIGIWTCNADGSGAVELFSKTGYQADNPIWSPDGQRLAFSLVGDASRDVFVIPAKGGKPEPLAADRADEHAPGWSRDGKWIYFGSDRTGQFQLWKAPAGGGAATQVTRHGGFMATESHDGTTVYYLKSWARSSALCKMPVAGGEETQVLADVRSYSFAVVREGIYFISAAGQAAEAVVQFLEFSSGKVRLVAPAGKETGIGLSVSPDQKHLLFVREEGTGADLMLVENFR
jgi:Tol biopolymer transport system component/predicted Ser/Thr protein kinase